MNAPPHHSIREPQKVARLSRTFSHSPSAVDLAEPLRSLDETQPAEAARELLQTRDLAVLGVHSRKEADRLGRAIESLRNHLAHAQQLEAEHLATATKLASLIDSILRAEVAQRIVELQQNIATISPAL